MSLVLVAICGIVLTPMPEPMPALSSLYSQHFGCTPEVRDHYDGDLVAAADLPSYFPSEPALWPILTEDRVGGSEYKQLVSAGIKPGILLPADALSLFEPDTFMRYRRAMRDGAIPVAQ